MPDQLKANEDIKSDVKPRGANRTTKVAGKLKVLPEQPDTLPALEDKVAIRRSQLIRDQAGSSGTAGDSDEGDVEESEEYEACTSLNFNMSHYSYLSQVYNQISLIPEGTARRDALKLTKKKAKSLPRVTAYATAR